jgi:uncharacterized membrane protein YjjP (DUF1212 family)
MLRTRLATGKHLIDVHDALRSELTQLHDLVDQVAAGELDAGQARSHISQMTLRQNEWVLVLQPRLGGVGSAGVVAAAGAGLVSASPA